MVLVIIISLFSCTSIFSFPKIPKLIFGVNQYNIGKPEDLAKNFPLKEAEIIRLKEIGINTIRVPIYPIEIGVDPSLFKLSEPGEYFDFKRANAIAPDWRSLDAFLELMEKYNITPYLSPSPEYNDMQGNSDWSSKAWLRLHVPADAEKALWFTELVAKHVSSKFGGNVIYGWFEDWYWGSYAYRGDFRMDADIKKELAIIYKNNIKSLNKSWNTDFNDFKNIKLPTLYNNGIPSEAYNNPATYDIRLVIDNLQKKKLIEMKKKIKKLSPSSMWAGGSMCNEFGGLLDGRSCAPVKTKATLMTYAEANDILTADTYAPPRDYKVYYRTLAKIANLYNKKLMISEISAVNPNGFTAVSEVGGPIGGCLAWVGKEDLFGFFKSDGTERTENLEAFAKLHETLLKNNKYIKGNTYIYLPLETLEYTISEINHMDSYYHVCDELTVQELEPVFTKELKKLPKGSYVYCLEKQMPLNAIKIFQAGKIKLITPHKTLIDENGNEYEHSNPNDFWANLASTPKGYKLKEAFQRVIERETSLSYNFNGASASTDSELHKTNSVISGRPNDITNIIDASIYNGITFADKKQKEIIYIQLPEKKLINSAFIDLYEGDISSQQPGSRIPREIKIFKSEDGKVWEPLNINTKNDYPRIRISFDEINSKYIKLDLGENISNDPDSGLKLVEAGLLKK